MFIMVVFIALLTVKVNRKIIKMIKFIIVFAVT
jgi:hypothetical protein